VDGTEAATRRRLTEVAPQTEPPILKWRPHTRSRRNRAARDVSGSVSGTRRRENARVSPTRPENTGTPGLAGWAASVSDRMVRSSPRSVPPVDQCPTEIFRSCRALSRRLAALSCTAAVAGARKAPGSAPFSRSRLVKRVSPVFDSSPSAAPQERRTRFRLGRASRASADRAAQGAAPAAHP
jgi:hypothetical protein